MNRRRRLILDMLAASREGLTAFDLSRLGIRFFFTTVGAVLEDLVDEGFVCVGDLTQKGEVRFRITPEGLLRISGARRS